MSQRYWNWRLKDWTDALGSLCRENHFFRPLEANYDYIASQNNMPNDRTLIHLYQYMPEMQHFILQLPSDANILDLWCGKWIALSNIQSQYPWFKTYGVDIIFSQIWSSSAWCTYIEHDMNLGIPPGMPQFDFIYSYASIQYLNNWYSSLYGVYQKLKPWSKAFLNIWTKNHIDSKIFSRFNELWAKNNDNVCCFERDNCGIGVLFLLITKNDQPLELPTAYSRLPTPEDDCFYDSPRSRMKPMRILV